ncbi:glucan biosynthesis protein [Afifella pfennigii]|uniref:glucan biosynthesis protein n=1 Tax=Afifella pfennigii TaxID=209897 RepID=UPI00047CE0C7|nr:glucan biosynthesis protein G [Afifella pfennigii]
MNRRAFLLASLAGATASLAPPAAAQQRGEAVLSSTAGEGQASPAAQEAFSFDWLKQRAAALSQRPYQAPTNADLPQSYAEMDYSLFREIEFNRERRLWRGEEGLAFQLDFLHRGALFKERVDIFTVEGGVARPVLYDPGLFNFRAAPQPPAGLELGFSGFRVHNPINSPDVWDEFLVFQGATYFRAVGQGQFYGISARALALKTGERSGEEFPRFTAFYIVKPEPGEEVLTIFALLDSPSTTGAYRFLVRPGRDTVIEVTGALCPRKNLMHVGLAPLTSMYLFGPLDRTGFDDYRPQVHDSDGLQMLSGNNEWLWRPLGNFPSLQSSSFMDPAPRGFGLVQRARRFEEYQDLEAHYERRPSVWVEPIGSWANGTIQLLEIPTELEIHDNIVAFWKPSYEIAPGAPYTFAYRMRWTDRPKLTEGFLYAAESRGGRNLHQDRKLYVLDFVPEGGGQPRLDDLRLEISSTHGEVESPVLQPNPPIDGVRATFLFSPADEPTEFRLRLLRGDTPASETWLYRWIPQ